MISIKRLVAAGVLAIGGLAAGLGAGWYAGWSQSALPATLLKQVSFPLFVPSPLPAGYKLAGQSATLEDGVFAYLLQAPDGSKIVVSQQAKPSAKILDDFYAKELPKAVTVAHMPYPSVLGNAPAGGSLLSIVTEQTWLQISSTASGSNAALTFIAGHLQLLR